MSEPRSNADLEQLLRRTYAEVAGRTTVPDHVAADVVQLSPAASSPPRRRWVLSAAAVLVLLVAGLFVLSNRDAEQPAGRDGPTRVLPGWVPRVAASDGRSDRPFALTEVRSDRDRDRITYADGDGSITIELDRSRSMTGHGEPVTVRASPGRRTSSTLSWLGPDDAVVEVTWTGRIDEQMIDSFVGAIAYVDDEAWTEATGTGGFRRQPPGPLATVRIDAAAPFDVVIVGDLHEGLSLQTGMSGFIALGTGRCSAALNYTTSDLESNVTGYVILAPGDAAAALLRTVGADERRIDLTSLLPLVDVSIGGAVYEDRPTSAALPLVDCETAP